MSKLQEQCLVQGECLLCVHRNLNSNPSRSFVGDSVWRYSSVNLSMEV